MRELFQIADRAEIARYRAMLPYLEETVTMLGDDGIRYTFCAPDIAPTHGLHWINFHTTLVSNGAKHWKRGHLQQLENFVYQHERTKIINDILHNLDRMVANPRLKGHNPTSTDPFPEDFGDGFIDDMRHAIDRTNELRGLRFPRVDSSARLQVRRIKGVWWLFHREWMPLCFDSFEEAVKFANKYIVRGRVNGKPRA